MGGGRTSAAEVHGLGALMLDPETKCYRYLSEIIPEHVMATFQHRENAVVVTETAAVLVALQVLANHLRGRDVLLFVDSESVEAAIVKGASSADDLSGLIDAIWRTAVKDEVHVYVDRVPTDANPSDGPSRGFTEEVERRGAVFKRGGWAVRGLGRHGL